MPHGSVRNIPGHCRFLNLTDYFGLLRMYHTNPRVFSFSDNLGNGQVDFFNRSFSSLFGAVGWSENKNANFNSIGPDRNIGRVLLIDDLLVHLITM